MTKIRIVDQPKDGDFLTVEQAAQILGIKPAAVRNYLNQDKFTTYKFKTLTLLRKDEVERWPGRKRNN